MTEFKIIWKQSPNYRKGRNGYKPIAVVNHITAGQFPGCLNWLTNKQSQASSTYIVTRKGEIYQIVKDEDTHWANGGVNKPNWKLIKKSGNKFISPNYYTISIEHEGYYTKDSNGKINGNFGGDGNLTEQQYQATLWLHKQIIKKWNIPIDRDHIISHAIIDSVNRPNCPGKLFPWDRLFKDLKTEQTIKIKVNNKIIDGILYQNQTLAPVRVFGEALGKEVVYKSKDDVTVGGVKIDIILIENKSYAQVRYLAEKLGRTVNWDQSNQTVEII